MFARRESRGPLREPQGPFTPVAEALEAPFEDLRDHPFENSGTSSSRTSGTAHLEPSGLRYAAAA
jgi:hypothetical protein